MRKIICRSGEPQKMTKSILSREDTVYKAVPDLAICHDRTLVCVYRESLFHLWHPFSRIIIQRSIDGGQNWGPKQVVDECSDYLVEGGFNTPRLLSVGDDNLIIVCDWIPPRESEFTSETKIFVWRSSDAGATWLAKDDTGIRGHICPGVIKLRSGRIILGASRFDSAKDNESPEAFQSVDNGSTWTATSSLARVTPELTTTEPTFVELENGLVVCYLREDKERLRAYKSFSWDEGKTWEGPYPTSLLICRGRPQAGLLENGEVAITYGFGVSPRLLTLHVETQEIAADAKGVENVETGHHIQKDYHRFFVDHDRSIHPDGGYSGWVQLPDGDIYVIQYIVDDAPMGHIRSYRINRADWTLSPNQRLPRLEKIDPGGNSMDQYKPNSYVPYHQSILEAIQEATNKDPV